MLSPFSSLPYITCQESDNDADTESDNNPGVTDEEGDEESDAEKGGCSLWHAFWNLVNVIEGTGVLGLPYAVREGGIIVVLGLIILAVISNYTGQILIGCLYTKDPKQDDEEVRLVKKSKEKDERKRVRLTYEDIGEVCLPGFGGKIVVATQVLELMSVSTLYLVLSGSLLVNTFPRVPITHRGWIALSTVLVLPTVFLKSLAHVAWLSLVSTVSLMATVAAVIVYGISVHDQWDIDSIVSCNVDTVPVGLGIVLFSYAAHPLLPGIENALRDKSKFPLIMNISFVFAAISKVLFAVTAYLAFSDKTKEVITNNLPPGPIRTTVCVLLVLNVLFSYAFPMFTVIHCVTNSIVSRCCVPEKANFRFPVILRVVLVLLTMLAALLIPHFALLMAFIGSLTGACLVFIFPPVFNIILRRSAMYKLQIAADVLIIIFGVSTGIVGVVYSGKALVKAYTA
ncbi:predicted protein [Nematostella vectensis]|uniref:Amino acid transporter transmembrane domain-containing protein n=1 Tax=Nematostella vectensis TaxID=45351 RepID=A7S4J8_NEMVE|nr:vesicular inhibitory amino acid transporter [Nematostella vectensis]EDO41339.1 predicted protein [Nematostella vectensis]|eukprot:XP_001633402.1 predicted protein [Nematostella vectensis]